MNPDDFFNMTGEEMFEVISKPVSSITPLYVERLKTAIEKKNPLVIVFLGDRIIDSYKKIKQWAESKDAKSTPIQ